MNVNQIAYPPQFLHQQAGLLQSRQQNSNPYVDIPPSVYLLGRLAVAAYIIGLMVFALGAREACLLYTSDAADE